MATTKPKASQAPLRGTLQQFIFSPDGGIEGLLVQSGKKVVQLVTPEELQPRLLALAVGETLRAEVRPRKASDKGEAELPVYELRKLLTPAATTKGGARGVQGKVVAFNYAKHGERNGFILDTGDFVHTKPHGFRASKIKLGQMVKATGATTPLQNNSGAVVIEARRINGVAVRR